MAASPVSDATLDSFAACAEAMADAAAAVIKPYFRAPFDLVIKGDLTPVTAADRAAEQAMRKVLAERFPDHGVLGEEYGQERADAPFQWVLDPIDGTKAFVTGRPIFGSLIALLHEGVPLLGHISQPVLGERWLGLRGRRTLHRPGCAGGAAVARTRACESLAVAQLSATAPEMFPPADLARFRRVAGRVRQLTWGGDCYQFALLALGHIDVVIETTHKIWDWAALGPVVEGAGGCFTDWQGRALRPGAPGEVLGVGDPARLDEVVALLNAA
ncbi:MAG: inositol monophosphatase family protein [Alphaproteobacteria bacterium]|nr:inositol monophosphatase family protein [Alphaproteobacteria bacterium]